MVPGSVQPKPCVICPGLDVAVGWGFAAVRDFAAGLEFAAGVENAPVSYMHKPTNYRYSATIAIKFTTMTFKIGTFW